MHYPPTLYAAVHDGNPGDIDFYRRQAGRSSRVLELGCGSGRVSAALAADGAEVVGLDRDWQALAHARAPRFQRVCADMTAFAFARPFDRIFVPYNGLCCLLSVDAIAACLRCVVAHLAPGGRFVFDVYNADGMALWESPPPPAESQLGSVGVDAERWTVSEYSVVEIASQRVDATYTHRRARDGKTVVCTIAQRYLLSHELAPLCEAAGLSVAAVHGGFAGEPFDEYADHLVVTAVALPARSRHGRRAG